MLMRIGLTLLLCTTMVIGAALRPSYAQPTPVIVMVGESTTHGDTWRDKLSAVRAVASPINAAITLEWTLGQIDYPCQYAGLPVRNWAISASNTEHWFVDATPYCHFPGIWPTLPLEYYACNHGLPFARAVLPLAAERGEQVVALLVNAQGTNDAHNHSADPNGYNPHATALRIAGWRTIMGSVPVFISPPFNRADTSLSGPVSSGATTARQLEAYVSAVRRIELRLGVLNGPDWGVVLPHPTFQPDGFHFQDGFYAAAGTFWLDKLCPAP